MKRKAVNAGRFYPRFKEELTSLIDKCFLDSEFGPGKEFIVGNKIEKRMILGGICPHAGYTYSGAAAAFTYQKLFSEGIPKTIIILGTQHTGYQDISVMKTGEWETPLGNLKINTELAQEILNDGSFINDDSAFLGFPHGREHNIEVQLPFIKYCATKAKSDIKIVPIKIGTTKFKKIQDIGETLGRILKDKDVAIVASSDMTHKSPENVLKPAKDLKKMKIADDKVINCIEKFNWMDALQNALSTTVCGPQTIATLMIACKEMGAIKTEILKYYNSYEKMGGSGPCDYSVGYLSAIFSK